MQISSYICQSVVLVFVMCSKQIRRSTAAPLDLPIACVFKSHLQASCPSSYPICLNFVWFKNNLWTSYINQHSQNKLFSKTQIWTISLTPDPYIPQIAYKWFLDFCGFKSFKPPATHHPVLFKGPPRRVACAMAGLVDWSPLRHQRHSAHLKTEPSLAKTAEAAGDVEQWEYIDIYIHIYTYWLVALNIFHNICDNPSHWLICFNMVKTTNQIYNGNMTLLGIYIYICIIYFIYLFKIYYGIMGISWEYIIDGPLWTNLYGGNRFFFWE
jgi:hypothetical protein